MKNLHIAKTIHRQLFIAATTAVMLLIAILLLPEVVTHGAAQAPNLAAGVIIGGFDIASDFLKVDSA